MTSPDWPVLGWVALIALCFVPRTLRALRDRKAARVAAVRRHEWADARLEAELRRVVDQRDRYLALYHEAVQRNAWLLRRYGGDTPIAVDAEATIAVRALNADELAWEQEMQS